MKKFILTLAVCWLLTITSAFAGPKKKDPPLGRPRISANEMITIGFAAAGVIGVAGYFVIRRRRVRSHQS